MPTDNPILKKMRLKPENSVLVLNAPDESWEDLFAANKTETAPDTIVLFAQNQESLENSMEKAKKLLPANGTIWLAFPKGTSILETDLSRDKVLGLVNEADWKFLTLISLDKDWSAFSFRKQSGSEKGKTSHTKPAVKESEQHINMLTREITLPEDLKTVLDSDKNAKTYFDRLAFSHRKEYVLWITEAKKPETRQRRMAKMLEMLNQGGKNPTDKKVLR